MEFFASMLNIFLAFALTTLLGYGYWYVMIGRRLKRRHEEKGRETPPVRKETRRKGKSDAELINETMGYDFIPMRSVSHGNGADKLTYEPEVAAAPAPEPAVPERDAKERNWADSRAEGFSEQKGSLGASSEHITEAEKAEGWDDYCPDYSEEDMKRWDANLARWEEEAPLAGNEEGEDDNDDDGDTPLEINEEFWEYLMDNRDKDKEEIRKKSNAIHKLEYEEGGQEGEASLEEYEIDYREN